MPTAQALMLPRRALVTATPEETVRDAARKMKEYNVGSVLIVDSEGRLVGIFTERDLVRVVAEGLPLDAKLAEVMSRHPVVAKPGESVWQLASKMLEHNLRHIPVVDEEGKPIGVVSIRDVLRFITASETPP